MGFITFARKGRKDMGKNGLQNEFEEFIKNIIEQVSEEIYLEDLKRIYDSYQECLNGMQTQTKYLSDSAEQIKEERQTVMENMTSVRTEMEENTGRIEKALDIFYSGYKDILRQYEEKIVFLNEAERNHYNNQFQSILVETREKEKQELEESFRQCETKIKELTGTIATTESLNQVTEELEQVRTALENTTSLKYAQTLTDFESQLKSVGLQERKTMEEKLKEAFQNESEKIKQMLQSYKTSLTQLTAKTMTQKDMAEFNKNLTKYTSVIQSLAESRYEETLKAFEQKLFQMGNLQFSNYVRALNESSLKISDLELFLQQIRILEENMKYVVRKSEEEYQMIFTGFRSEVQKVNEETKEEFMNSLNELFRKQYNTMKQSMAEHIHAIKEFQGELKELMQCVQLIRELAEKDNANVKLMARVISNMSQKEDSMMERLQYMADAVEDNTKQLEYTMRMIEDGNKQTKETAQQVESNQNLLERIARQNESQGKQIQSMVTKQESQSEEMSQQVTELMENNRQQNIILQALLGDSSSWKVDLFDKIEINLVYVMLAMLVWICIRVA